MNEIEDPPAQAASLVMETPPSGAHRPALASAPRGVGAVRRHFAPWADAGARPIIEFQGVRKTFGPVVALDCIDFKIYPREFFALLGPSGCGKTTLLRILAGFERPTSGRVLLDGEDITDLPPEARPINMMFQSYALFPHLNVEDNIAFGLRRSGLNAAAIAGRVAEMLQLVQLQDFGKRRVHQLSGGQKQRVALARALAKRPKVLALDEPLAALDKNLRQNTQFELMSIQEQLGMTFIIVTHDQEEAMTVSDRIAVMNHGAVEQIATPAEVYEQPASRFVATFIGDINLIEGAVSEREGERVRLALPDGAALVVETSQPVAAGVKATIAVRPEKIEMTRLIEDGAEAATLANTFDGEVIDIGYLGTVSVYRVKLASGLTMTATVPNRSRLVEQPVYWHERVRLRIPEDAAIILRD